MNHMCKFAHLYHPIVWFKWERWWPWHHKSTSGCGYSDRICL